ncbi:hypothetical protein P389DRAFT_87865 [Cystobasidium minutum MCA 4210]|uniref:uncharacterized protein n=1 Tax=Cystobasidium minutum MCA 4210 TaxID=1397322 RepID=UPI0034CED195|eukprot:jgi/Rhomi1/87865/CE87864_289
MEKNINKATSARPASTPPVTSTATRLRIVRSSSSSNSGTANRKSRSSHDAPAADSLSKFRHASIPPWPTLDYDQQQDPRNAASLTTCRSASASMPAIPAPAQGDATSTAPTTSPEEHLLVQPHHVYPPSGRAVSIATYTGHVKSLLQDRDMHMYAMIQQHESHRAAMFSELHNAKNQLSTCQAENAQLKDRLNQAHAALVQAEEHAKTTRTNTGFMQNHITVAQEKVAKAQEDACKAQELAALQLLTSQEYLKQIQRQVELSERSQERVLQVEKEAQESINKAEKQAQDRVVQVEKEAQERIVQVEKEAQERIAQADLQKEDAERHALERVLEAERNAQEALDKAQQAERETEEALGKARQAEERAVQAESKAQEAATEAQLAGQRAIAEAAQANMRIQAMQDEIQQEKQGVTVREEAVRREKLELSAKEEALQTKQQVLMLKEAEVHKTLEEAQRAREETESIRQDLLQKERDLSKLRESLEAKEAQLEQKSKALSEQTESEKAAIGEAQIANGQESVRLSLLSEELEKKANELKAIHDENAHERARLKQFQQELDHMEKSRCEAEAMLREERAAFESRQQAFGLELERHDADRKHLEAELKRLEELKMKLEADQEAALKARRLIAQEQEAATSFAERANSVKDRESSANAEEQRGRLVDWRTLLERQQAQIEADWQAEVAKEGREQAAGRHDVEESAAKIDALAAQTLKVLVKASSQRNGDISARSVSMAPRVKVEEPELTKRVKSESASIPGPSEGGSFVDDGSSVPGDQSTRKKRRRRNKDRKLGSELSQESIIIAA